MDSSETPLNTVLSSHADTAGTGTAEVPRSTRQPVSEAAPAPSDIAVEQVPVAAPAWHHQQSQPQQQVAADGSPTLDDLMAESGMHKCPGGPFEATSMLLDDKYIRATYFTSDSFPTSMAPPASATASGPDVNIGVTAEAQTTAEAHTAGQTSTMCNAQGMLGSDAQQPAEASSTMQDSNVGFGHADTASSDPAFGHLRQELPDSTAALSDFLQQHDDSMNMESNNDSLLNTVDSSAHAPVDSDTTGMPFMTSDAPVSSGVFHMPGSNQDSSSVALDGSHFDDISWEGVFDDAAPFADLDPDYSSFNIFPGADCTSSLGGESFAAHHLKPDSDTADGDIASHMTTQADLGQDTNDCKVLGGAVEGLLLLSLTACNAMLEQFQ